MSARQIPGRVGCKARRAPSAKRTAKSTLLPQLENAARFCGRSPDVRPSQRHTVFQLYLFLAAWPGTSHLKLYRSILFTEWGYFYLRCRIVVSTKETVPKVWLSYIYVCVYMYACMCVHVCMCIWTYIYLLWVKQITFPNVCWPTSEGLRRRQKAYEEEGILAPDSRLQCQLSWVAGMPCRFQTF